VEVAAEVAAEIAAEVVAEVAEAVVAVVWFIDCGKSTKSRRDCLFLFFYIYKIKKVVG